jgi:sRNA-binding carbon storage regulator CsrA
MEMHFINDIKRNLCMNSSLTLTRKPSPHKNELIFTLLDKNGSEIFIKQTIQKIRGNQVTIKIEAPLDVNISRPEIIANC